MNSLRLNVWKPPGYRTPCGDTEGVQVGWVGRFDVHYADEKGEGAASSNELPDCLRMPRGTRQITLQPPRSPARWFVAYLISGCIIAAAATENGLLLWASKANPHHPLSTPAQICVNEGIAE